MPLITQLKWATHRARWSACTKCHLCEKRTKVVLGKGQIPCDVLFVGEAPGQMEDVQGIPFAGPAGQLLHVQIKAALEEARCYLRLAYTNVIACIPLGEDRRKVQEPAKAEIDACRPRLLEFIQLVKPRALVAVGRLSEKQLPGIWPLDAPGATIIHPAAILRMGIEQRSDAVQQGIVTLSDLFSSLA